MGTPIPDPPRGTCIGCPASIDPADCMIPGMYPPDYCDTIDQEAVLWENCGRWQFYEIEIGDLEFTCCYENYVIDCIVIFGILHIAYAANCMFTIPGHYVDPGIPLAAMVLSHDWGLNPNSAGKCEYTAAADPLYAVMTLANWHDRTNLLVKYKISEISP